MISVMILGGEGLFRSALAVILAHEPDLKVVAALSREQADSNDHQADVAVLDLDGWEAEGVATARRLTTLRPMCRVLVLTRQRRPDTLRAILDARVAGVVGKGEPPKTLARWIRRVADGERVIDPSLAAVLLDPDSNPLTPREQAALRLAADGASCGEIAQRLYLAPGTIRNYLSAAIRKTGARNRLEAARRARDAGWL